MMVKVYVRGTHRVLTGTVVRLNARGVVLQCGQITIVVPRALAHHIAPLDCDEAAFLEDMARWYQAG